MAGEKLMAFAGNGGKGWEGLQGVIWDGKQME